MGNLSYNERLRMPTLHLVRKT